MTEHLLEYRLYLVAAGTAFVACLLITPVVRRAARGLRIVDSPDTHRKLHDKAIPLGGGVAILLSFLLSLGIVATFSDSQSFQLAHDLQFVVGLVAAAVTICFIGVIDDRYSLRGRQKLLGQLVAASALVCSGLVISNIAILGLEIQLGLLAVPFTYFWLLGAINALNFLDGADGLATSVGIVLSLAIAGMAFLTQHSTEAFLACAMAGGLTAFLVYNRPSGLDLPWRRRQHVDWARLGSPGDSRILQGAGHGSSSCSDRDLGHPDSRCLHGDPAPQADREKYLHHGSGAHPPHVATPRTRQQSHRNRGRCGSAVVLLWVRSPA